MADITIAFVQQFGANLYTLAQQKGSKLRDKVRFETLTGDKRFFDQIGATEARRVTDKFGDSPIIPTPFSRRACIPHDWEWGDMVDQFDKVKTLIDPTSGIVLAGSYALGRSIDDEIIAAATGTVLTGVDGTTPLALPDTQKIAVTLGAAAGNAGMTIEKLIASKSLYGKADIDLDDPENKLYMAVTQQQLDDMLALTEIKSSDYNTVKALAEGKLTKYMGFEFVQTQRLIKDAATDIRKCFSWCKSGIALALPVDITTEISKRSDKKFNWYAYAKMSASAVRMEETKVVEIPCDESP